MAWANGFLQDGFSFLLLCKYSPAFCSANVHWFSYWVWGWKRLLRCQPRHSLCSGEVELPARLSTSCQLKELMTQSQAKHWAESKKRRREPQLRWRLWCQTASLKHSTQGNPPHQKAGWFLCSCSALETHIGAPTHISFLLHSHKHISPQAGILRLLYPPVGRAILGSWNDY